MNTDQAVQLLRLDRGESIQRSKLPVSLRRALETAGVVRLESSGGGHLVRGLPGKVREFAKTALGIRDLDGYAAATPDNRSRESMARIAGDSKALPNSPLEGLFVRAFSPSRLGKEAIAPTPRGTATFITPEKFPSLYSDASLLLAVENPACFLNIEGYLSHFPGFELGNALVVLQWSWGERWRAWLRNWRGSVQHFPDYDPAGLSIFASQILPHAPGARILIPEHLPQLIDKLGSRKLFLDQEAMLVGLPAQPDVQNISALILAHRKGLEQEHLVSV